MKQFWNILVLIATIIGFGIICWLLFRVLITLAFLWMQVLIGLLVVMLLVFAIMVLWSMLTGKRRK